MPIEYDTKTTIEIMKKIMLLPCNKETNTVKSEDVIKLIEELAGKLPEEEAKKYMRKLEEKQKNQED